MLARRILVVLAAAVSLAACNASPTAPLQRAPRTPARDETPPPPPPPAPPASGGGAYGSGN